MNAIQKARERLRAAGIREDMIGQLTATSDMAQGILDLSNKQLELLAQTNSAAGLSAYGQAATTEGFGDTNQAALPSGMGQGIFSYVPEDKDYETSPTGAIRYPNGVIANPETGSLLFPPNKETVKGSPMWLATAQDKWSDSKIQQWRKTLNKFGYDIAAKGGWDATFKGALADYYAQMYLNYGKPIKLDQAAATQGEAQAAYDPVLIRNDVRTLFEQAGIDDPTDDEVKPFAQWAAKMMRDKVAKGVDPTHASYVVKEKLTQKFQDDPIAQQFINQQEEEEENTRLRDSLLSIAQITER